jgi:uncharacterized membrane protein
MKTPALSLSISPHSRRLALIVLRIVIPVAIVLLAIGPKAALQGLAHVPPVHLHWPQLEAIAAAALPVKLHLTAVMIALAIGVILLVGVKGTTMHRTLGWTWVVAMTTGAVSSLFIRTINHGALSFLHLFSGWVIIMLPMAVAFARRHKVRVHARLMTGLFTGGLILAGAFAFIPGRLMWDVFFR